MGSLSCLRTRQSAFFECPFYRENIFVRKNISTDFQNSTLSTQRQVIIVFVKGSVIEAGGDFYFIF